MADSANALEQRLMSLITSSWVSQALFVAAELDLASELAAGPRSAEELARLTDTDRAALERLLRALTTLEVCRETVAGTFELTELGALLHGDAPGSLRAWTRWWGGHLWPVFGNLLYSVKTGKSARTLLLGTEGFGHLERDRETASVFNQALAELTRMAAKDVVQAYDFSRFGRVMDVGGGYGELLGSILSRYERLYGVLFDLPHALEGARKHLGAAGVLDRCELVSGDFFEAVPGGADAYVLKSVIHDWNDEDSVRILESCRRVMHAQARVLLVEQVLPERFEATPAHQSLARSDLTMMVALAAQERTEAEFRSLLARAGLRLDRVVPAGSLFSVLEASSA